MLLLKMMPNFTQKKKKKKKDNDPNLLKKKIHAKKSKNKK